MLDVAQSQSTPNVERKHTFRFRIPVTVGLILTIIIASLSSALFMHTAWRLFVTRETDRFSSRVNEEIIRSVRRQANQIFVDSITAQRFLHSIFKTRLFDPDDNEQIREVFLSTLNTNPGFTFVSFGRPNGDFLGARRLDNLHIQWIESYYDSTTEMATRNIIEYELENNQLKEIKRFTLTNTYYAPQRSWYRRAMEVPDFTDIWTNVYVFSTSRRPGVNSATPLRYTDELYGVISIAIELGNLSDYIANIDVSENGVLFIINNDGELIAFEDKFEVVTVSADGNTLSLRSLATADSTSLRVVDATIQNGIITLDNTASSEQLSATVTGLDGKREYLIKFEPLADQENDELGVSSLNWFIGTIIPMQDITGGIEEEAQQLLLIVYSLITGLIAIIFFVVRFSFIKPIRKIAKQAEFIRRFDLESVHLPTSRVSEIDLLTQSISHMNSGLNSFRKYVPTELVQRLMSRGLEAKLGGVESDITIFFCDIERFTYISEIMRENIIGHLDSYFTHLSEIIKKYDGTIDKYIGDAIMAFWGAPTPSKNHATQACHASLKCTQILKQLRSDWKSRGKELLFVRFGLNSGKVLVGNFGSQIRMNYTAIGDPVNVAARLESLNKIYGTEILIGDKTYDQIHTQFVTRKMDRVAVYGRMETVEIYELLDVVDNDHHPDYYKWIEHFEEGLQNYRLKQWKKAIACFLEAHNSREGEDNPSLLFIKRCQHLMRKDVPEDWNGTFILKTK